METVTEVLSLVAHEIALEPVRFAVEVVQFLLLLGIVYVVAVGFGRRRGIVKGMLEDRRTRVIERLQAADRAQVEFDEALENSERTVAQARAEAASILAKATEEATAARERAKAEADAEAQAVLLRASEALEHELEELHVEVRDRLVEIVAQATRAVLSEQLSLAEQRERVQDAIMATVNRAEGGAGKARRHRPKHTPATEVG